MVNFLNRASDSLSNKRKETMSIDIIYRRPSTLQSVSLLASLGKTRFRCLDEFGRSLITWSFDFKVNMDDFIWSVGENITPIQGDFIITDDTIYEVHSFNLEPCWRLASAYKNAIRIHTKKRADI